VIIENEGIATTREQTRTKKFLSPPPTNDGMSPFRFSGGIEPVESPNFYDDGMSMNSGMIVSPQPLETSITRNIRTR
jgi:hypothetical protein